MAHGMITMQLPHSTPVEKITAQAIIDVVC